MRKIIISLAIIAAIGTIVVTGTTAFFSDTETSTGNTFTAGSIDLKIDSQAHYNGMVCVRDDTGAYTWQAENNGLQVLPIGQYPVAGTPCTGSWELKDLVADTKTNGVVASSKFFDYYDLKPGDSGENTISLHVLNNDAWLCAEVSNLTNNDNGLTEPESALDQTDGLGNGELQSALIMNVWRDDGDNIFEPNDGEVMLLTGHPVNGILPIYDASTGSPLLGDTTTYLGVSWNLPNASGNEVQTDSVTGDISFWAEQARNNPNFYCNRVSSTN